jgi:hypothetical protein
MTDAGKVAALKEAKAFASSLPPSCASDLEAFFWPVIAEGAGVSEVAEQARMNGSRSNGVTSHEELQEEIAPLLEAATKAKAKGDDHAQLVAVKDIAERLARNGAEPLTVEEWAGRMKAEGLCFVGPFRAAVAEARKAFRQEQVDSARQRRFHQQAEATEQRTAGDMLTDSPAPDQVIPQPYFIEIGATGYAITGIRDLPGFEGGDEPERHIIAFAPVLISARMRDADEGREYLQLSFRRRTGWIHQVVDRGVALYGKKLVELASDGFPVAGDNAGRLARYLHCLEAANRDRLPCARISAHLGSQGRGARDGFLWGNTFLFPDGQGAVTLNLEVTRPEDWPANCIAFRGQAPGDEQIAAGFHSEGTLAGWIEAVKVLANRPRALFVLYCAFAAPLLEILGAPNFILDVAGRTTIGKTTVARVAASVWGRPDERAADGALWCWDATRVWLERACAILSGLPVILDDTKRAKNPAMVGELLYTVANGRGRGRGNRKSLDTVRVWRTLLISTGEAPATSFTQDGGTRTRCLELRGGPFGRDDQETRRLVDLLNHRVRLHYGHAGPAFVRFLLRQRSEWETLCARYQSYAETLATRATTTEGGRLAQYGAVIYVAAELVHEALGLPWDFRKAFRAVWDSIVAEASDAAGDVRSLRDLFSWCVGHQEAFDGRHRSDGMPPPGGWAGKWEKREGWEQIAILPTACDRVLRELGYEPAAIYPAWRERGWLEVTSDPTHPNPNIRMFGEQKRMMVILRSAIDEVEK